MSYIGKYPTTGNFVKIDDISSSFDGSTTTFTIQQNSVDFEIPSLYQCILSLNGILQEPGTSFTTGANSTEITFSSAPYEGDTFWMIVINESYAINQVSDGAISTAKISSGAIDYSKLASALLASAIEAQAGTATNKLLTASTGKDAILALNPFSAKLLHVKDVKASGINGGNATAGSWIKRTLNTTVYNGITGASLATDQITLPTGTYHVYGSCPVYNVQNHVCRLENVTDGTTALTGSSEYAGNSGNTTNRSVISGRFTIASPKIFELQHQVTLSNATNGLGVANTFGTNTYSDLQIWKVD